METIYLYPLAGILLGVFLGWILFRRDKKLEIDYLKNQVKLEELAEENKKNHIDLSASRERGQNLFEQKEELDLKVENLRITNLQLKEEQATLIAQKKAFEERVCDQKNDLERMKQSLENHFKNLAQGILEEKSKNFREFSKEHITHLISPFGKDLKEFKEKYRGKLDIDLNLAHKLIKKSK